MRKFLVTAAFAVTMALGAVVSPVAAQPAEQANCLGDIFSTFATANGRVLGAVASTTAQQFDGLGDNAGPAASTNCGDGREEPPKKGDPIGDA